MHHVRAWFPNSVEHKEKETKLGDFFGTSQSYPRTHTRCFAFTFSFFFFPSATRVVHRAFEKNHALDVIPLRCLFTRALKDRSGILTQLCFSQVRVLIKTNRILHPAPSCVD